MEGHELRGAAVSELEGLSARIPALVEGLPDVMHDKPGNGDECSAALSYMLSNLLDCADSNVSVCCAYLHQSAKRMFSYLLIFCLRRRSRSSQGWLTRVRG